MEKPILDMKLTDLFRAAMANHCGNEGFIGIAPDGSRYHVVVPVDRQIARGLKFWIAPDDGHLLGDIPGGTISPALPMRFQSIKVTNLRRN